MSSVHNSINRGGGGGTSITVVANYSALPDPTTVSGQFYWCENSQGTAWLPGSLGGTYYSAGMYYSNGVSWSFIAVPYQATQDEVNTGTNTDKFVTPSTLSNSNWAFTTAKVLATTLSGLSVLTGGTIVSTDTVLVAFGKLQNQINSLQSALAGKENTITAGTTAQYYRGDKTFQTLNVGAVSGLQTELDLKDVLPVLYEKHANVPVFGSASLNNLEGVVFVQSGATARTFADTNVYTRRQRMGLTVAVTGNLAQARQSITYFNRNSNLDIIIGVGFAENCTNANVRAFAGVTSNTATFSNIEPTALTNCIGLAKLTTSNNLHLIHNDSSGTATAIDLGASFPSNTVETDFYILRLKTNGSNIDYTVTRVNTGGSTSGTLTTDLPATTQALNFGYYVVQNTGANTTTGIDYFGTNLIKS